MEVISFRNSKVVLPDAISDVASIAIESGQLAKITATGDSISSTHFDDVTVFHGFIDIHIHGAVGVDVNTADAEGLLKVAGFLARNGVTAWMPTLVPDSDENYRRAIDAIDGLMLIQTGKPVAQAVGVHYEGVFASEAMCGALRPEFFKTYDVDRHPNSQRTTPSAQSGGHPSFVRRGVEENHPVGEAPPPLLCKEGSLIDLPMLKNGIHMTTLAPEVEGGIELIEKLVSQDWIVAIGHTKADPATLDRAFAAGARHMTHFFNAMTGVHHRDLGVAGWGLANKDVTFDIIADGVHVRPEMLGVACRSKTADKVLLISDSVAPTGLGDGEYDLWGGKISVKNVRTRNENGNIAGSVIAMNDAVRTMRTIGFSEIDLAKMASSNPAKLLGISDERGSIEIGKRADLVGIDASGNIVFTMIGGEIVPK